MGGLLQKKPLVPPPFAGDPVLPGVRAQFLKGDTRQLERLLSLDSAEDRYFFASELCQGLPREAVEQWVRQQANNPCALFLRASHGPPWAWEARTAQAANKVTAEQWEEFARRLEIGRGDLEAYQRLRPQDPNVYATMLILAKGENRTIDEQTVICNQLRQLDPQHYPGLRNYLDSILKKWGGSHQKALDFAMQAMRDSPAGSAMGGLVLSALVEEWFYLMTFDQDFDAAEDYRQQPQVLSVTEEAYTRSLGSPHFVETAATIHMRNESAFWLYLTGADAPLRHELNKIGKRLTKWPWCYLGDPGKTFAEARKMAGLK